MPSEGQEILSRRASGPASLSANEVILQSMKGFYGSTYKRIRGILGRTDTSLDNGSGASTTNQIELPVSQSNLPSNSTISTSTDKGLHTYFNKQGKSLADLVSVYKADINVLYQLRFGVPDCQDPQLLTQYPFPLREDQLVQNAVAELDKALVMIFEFDKSSLSSEKRNEETAKDLDICVRKLRKQLDSFRNAPEGPECQRLSKAIRNTRQSIAKAEHSKKLVVYIERNSGKAPISWENVLWCFNNLFTVLFQAYIWVQLYFITVNDISTNPFVKVMRSYQRLFFSNFLVIYIPVKRSETSTPSWNATIPEGIRNIPIVGRVISCCENILVPEVLRSLMIALAYGINITAMVKGR